MDKRLTGAKTDDEGRVYVPGDKVARLAGAEMARSRFYACPWAMVRQPWVTWALALFRRIDAGWVALRDIIAAPSAALLDALDIIASEVAAVREASRPDVG